MSVYKHEYQAYTGPLISRAGRIRVLMRYALAEAWSSKVTIALVTGSLLPAVVFLVGIFLANNPLARMLIIRGSPAGLTVNATYFLRTMATQCWLGMAVTAWVAPRMITFDLADNALPILLSHPITRFDYLLGKFLALTGLLSLLTWVPCLALFVYQGYSSPTPWLFGHLTIAFGMFIGSLVWIAVLGFVGLAFSSWVKWRVVATAVIFAAVFVPAGVGGIMNAILRTRWGMLLNLPAIMIQLWQRLLGAPALGGTFFEMPSSAIVLMLCFICIVCAAMLNVRIRAREVVRG